QLLHKQLDSVAVKEAEAIAKGLPASPGAAVGTAVFSSERAHELAQKKEKVILVRVETSPEDIEGMHASQGILTARGGMTSHAAVVARGMGKCCVAGCSDIIINEEAGEFFAGSVTIKEGEWITLDGTTGAVYAGQIPVVDPTISGDFGTFMAWADKARRLGVRTNADTPKDSKKAREFGAEGIGLCRTEHMFFEGDRIKAVREMILADSLEGRRAALDKILPYQKEDFKAIFGVMDGLPVKIRTLDPPLHEFLPKEEKDIRELSASMSVPVKKLRETINALHEFNPMLGHRGCRLGITYPEITEMQTRAIIEAAIEVKLEEGKEVIPEIMIPLVGHVKEFAHQKEIVDRTARGVMEEKGVTITYEVGTMIEIPRAALTADEIAPIADFFSFGTNDLTQMTCGFSRDDSGKFLPGYVDMGIYAVEPFQSLDQSGVGLLMKICVEKARAAKKGISLGICGEHGGDPASVEFAHRIGLDYVSCSPFRVPIARLAAAQAAIKEGI
ncbi:TPA: pyruvate, phosphate dikinase, partial [Candidatus Woesearchaeota archaeon]|nr:pyruvate, phosphate dikinase [Candidatus Woesearchaeota archaeon]